MPRMTVARGEQKVLGAGQNQRMRMKGSILIGSVLFGIGAVCGYLGGRLMMPDAAESVESGKVLSVEGPVLIGQRSAPGVGEGSKADSRGELLRILNFNSNRMYQDLQMLAGGLSPKDVADILNAPGALEKHHNYSMLENFLVGRLANGDPRAALSYVESRKGMRKESLMNVVLSGWAEADPAGVSQYLRQVPRNQAGRYIHSVLYSLARSDGRVALALIDDLKLGNRSMTGAVFESWAGRDPAGAAQAMLERGVESGERWIWQNTMQQWARMDPAAAHAFVEAMPEGMQKRIARQGVLVQLGESNPVAALQEFLSESPSAQRNNLTTQIINSWAQRDFPAAKAWIEQQPDKAMRNRWLLNVAEVWARTDPADAAHYLTGTASGNLRNQMVHTVANAWTEQDPDAAVAWLEGLPVGILRNQAAQVVLSTLARSDPDRALALSENLPADLRGRANAAVAQNLAEKDLGAALERVKQIPQGMARREALNGILYSDALRSNPKKALEYLDEIPTGAERGNFLNVLANSWSQQEPEEAFEWAKSLPRKSDREKAFAGMAHLMVESEPRMAADYLASLPENEGREHLSNLARQWAMNDLESAREWWEGLPEGEARNRVGADMIASWASLDPVEAARYVAELPAGKSQNEAALRVVTEWANHDARSAAAWVEAFPDRELQASAAESLMSRWAQLDPDSARNWLEKLPEGRGRDQAAMTYSSHLHEDPAAAVRAAGLISDENTRRSALQNAARRWLQIDEEAASAWIQSTGLQVEVVEELPARVEFE